MNRTELAELIRNGENSGVEFKRDTEDNRALAKELVAFANLKGGRVLLGVEKTRSVSGLTRFDPGTGVGDTPRAYDRLEHMGMGVPRKILKSMREINGSEPDLIEDGERFIVRLFNGRGPAPQRIPPPSE